MIPVRVSLTVDVLAVDEHVAMVGPPLPRKEVGLHSDRV